MQNDLVKTIQDFDLSHMKILNADMKINTKEFFRFLKIVQLLSSGVNLTPEDNNFMIYFFNRYVLLAQLRAEEKQWFDIVKDLTDGKYNDVDGNKEDLLLNSKRFYQDAKKKRMDTVAYLDSLKEIYF